MSNKTPIDAEQPSASEVDSSDWLAAQMAKAPHNVMEAAFKWIASDNEDEAMRALVLRQFSEGCIYRIHKLGEARRLREITDLSLSLERDIHFANTKVERCQPTDNK